MNDNTSILQGERFVVGMCRWLSRTGERRAADAAFGEHYLVMRKAFQPYLLVRLRFNDDYAADAMQALMLQHVRQAGFRNERQSEVATLLATLEPPRSDELLRQKVKSRWLKEMHEAHAESMKLPFLVDTVTPLELARRIDASNARLMQVSRDGAGHVEQCLRPSHAVLPWSRRAGPKDDEVADDSVGTDMSTDPIRADEKECHDAASAWLDRFFRPIVALDASLQRDAFEAAWRKKSLVGDASLLDFVFDMGQLIHITRGTRLRTLPWVYREAAHLAIDLMRREKAAGALEPRPEDDASESEADAPRAGHDGTAILAGELGMVDGPTFDEQLETFYEFLESPLHDARRALSEAIGPTARDKAARRVTHLALLYERDLQVFAALAAENTQTARKTQQACAVELELTRDEVRSSIGRLRVARQLMLKEKP